jgi:hypothetical protein
MTMYKLSQFPKNVRYTMTEYHLFATLPQSGRKVGSADIVAARAKHGEWDVKFPLKNVTTQMARLIDKIEDNDEPFRIYKGRQEETNGPGNIPVEYWLAPRGREQKKKKKKKANGK